MAFLRGFEGGLALQGGRETRVSRREARRSRPNGLLGPPKTGLPRDLGVPALDGSGAGRVESVLVDVLVLYFTAQGTPLCEANSGKTAQYREGEAL